MVIVKIMGGLGNQMFEYAMARRLAHRRGVPLKLDLSGYGTAGDKRAKGLESFSRKARLHVFDIAAEEATADEIARLKDPYTSTSTRDRVVRRLRRVWPKLGWPATHIVEGQYRFQPAMLELTAPCYLDGFWQTEKYFADADEVIRHDFTPSDPAVTTYAREYVARLRAGGGPVVALHVRRGDLAHAQEKLKNVGAVHGAPVGLDYIQAAINEFDNSVQFLVFSDSTEDIAWCKANIKASGLHFAEGHSDVQDMILMSCCDHNIIANSTFSWWAAWLNRTPGRRVISPRVWAHPGGFMVTDDLIPPDWKMIE